MFSYDNFRDLLNETIDLIKNKAPEDKEDNELKIESNIQALELIANEIPEEGLKNKALETLKNIKKTYKEISFTLSHTHLKKRKVKEINKTKESDLIEEEMLKNSTKLKEMSYEFNEKLKKDKNILDKTKYNLEKNKNESKQILRKTNKKEFNSSKYIFFTFLIFLTMYFFIKHI